MKKWFRLICQWKYAGWAIAALITGWLAIIPLHHLLLAYTSVVAMTLLGVGSWLTSGTLRKAKPAKKRLQRRHSQRLLVNFQLLKFGGCAFILALGSFAGHLTFTEQRSFELSQFNGVLFPASDP